MTIILFIFMSDIYFFCVCLMRDVLLLLSTILYDLWVKLYEYLMRGCEKAYQKAWQSRYIPFTALPIYKQRNRKR